MAFNMMEALAKNKPKEDAAPKAAQVGKNRLNIRYISVFDLEPSEDNFYSTQQIEELKWAIEMQGVLQNLTVVPLGGGKYRVKAGHRRRLACIALVEDGKKEFEFVPCDVRQESGDDEEKTLQERLLLILTNLPARQLSDWEQVRQYEELEDIIKALKKREKLPGRVRELIAEKMRRSPSQVSRYEAVSKRLSPAFKAELKNEGINISTAVELAALPVERQEELYREYQQKGALSIKDAQQAKEEAAQPLKEPEPDKQPIPGQIDFDGGTVPEEAQPQKIDPARPDPREERPQPREIPAPAPTVPDTPAPEEPGEETTGSERAAPPSVPKQAERVETRCVDSGICPHCGAHFDAAEAINYKTTGTQFTGPVPCPHCERPIVIFCSVEYFCSIPEGGETE